MVDKQVTGLVVGTLVLAGATYLILAPQSSAAKRESLLARARLDVGKDLREATWLALGLPEMAKKSWCGAWTLEKLREEGLTSATWKPGVGYVSALKLPLTSNPQPGDIMYQDQPNQHYALVESVNPLVTLDGNGKGGVVARTPRASTAGLVFYSIEKLL